MKKIIFTFLIVVLFPLRFAVASSDKTMIAQIETFLNGIQCLVAEFIQTNPDHSQSTGKIWMKRETKGMGKMRLDYSPEVGQRLIAKKGELIVYDLKDHSESRYNLDYTPAAFILNPKINLGKDVLVESVKKGYNFIEIVLTPKGDATGQSITLYFSLYETGNIKNLEQWVVEDPQGNQTLVQFIPDKISLNDPSLVPEAIFTP
jgi:outer membrane lipoprotein-sorting protein